VRNPGKSPRVDEKQEITVINGNNPGNVKNVRECQECPKPPVNPLWLREEERVRDSEKQEKKEVKTRE